MTHDKWTPLTTAELKGIPSIERDHYSRETTTHQLHRRSHAIASDDTSISRTTPLSRLQAPQVAIVWPSTQRALFCCIQLRPWSFREINQGLGPSRQVLQVYTGREATPEARWSTSTTTSILTTFSRLSNCWKTWRRMACGTSFGKHNWGRKLK